MKGFCSSLTAVALCLASYAAASPALPLFNIVRFKNEPCTISTTREGTCYTKAECENLGGTEGDSCAEGFGVCCEFSDMKCDDTSRQNNTYIVSGTVAASSDCTYTICPANGNICRIKFEFTALTLAAPAVGTAGADTAVGLATSIGSCGTDTFKITGGSGDGSPIICGTNTGQHMIMDSDGESCHEVNIVIGSSTTTTRSWDIHVTHHDCVDKTRLENTAGPKGCLQYHLGTSTGTGRIDNFGFPGAATYPTALLAATTHLQNQKYNICMRRHGTFNRICYTLAYTSAAAIDQGGFGTSVSNAAANADAKSAVDSSCQTDYITIPNGMAIAQTVANGLTAAAFKFCGRRFNSADSLAADIVICSRSLPFVVGVNFDGSEEVATTDMADMDEGFAFPSGFVGFHLTYAQDSGP